MGAWMIPGAPSAAGIAFPRERFVIKASLCRHPGPEANLMCFARAGHGGDHVWADWRGCRIDTPMGVIPFGGFAQ